MGRAALLGLLPLAVLFASDAGAGPQPRAQLTIWAQPPAPTGGAGYATPMAVAGAMIFEQRDVDIATSGDARLANVASTADPASIHLRDLTDPAAAITEQ